MTTHTDPDRALRELVELADPEREAGAPATAHLLDRVLATASEPEVTAPATDPLLAPSAQPPADDVAGTTSLRAFPRRHWQAGLLLAAAACSLMLAVPTVLPLLDSGSDTQVEQGPLDQSPGAEGGDAVSPQAPAAGGKAGELDAPAADRDGDLAGGGAGASSAQGATPEHLVRSGSVLVGTDDPAAARDRFVTTVLALGGRVTSESVISRDSSGGVWPEGAQDKSVSSPDMTAPDMAGPGVSYPYPWYPSGPGIWLSVQVPGDRYDEAMAAARDAGEVAQLQQSSYDVGTQVADVDARISSLEASLDRLNDLMDQAEDVSDVIALEKAISSRQAELDSLKAQQRDLANQTEMSALSLTLMSPTDAKASLEPAPPQTWWESFVDGLAEFWAWLGKALLIVSPLLIAGAIILGVRRRRGPGTATGPDGAEPGPAAP